MTSKKLLGACAALVLFAAANVRGATFFTDNFNYANGDLTVVDGTGANVSGGAWTPFSGTGFPAESITVVNGQAELLVSGSEDATRSIPNAGTDFMTAGETWYYGALVTVNDQRATPATTAIVKEYFMLMKDTTTTNFRSRLYVDNPSTGTGGAGFRFAIGPSSGAGNAVDWGTDLAFGTQYLVMASYEFDTGFVKMWVNPISQASTSVTATASPSFGTPLSELSLRQAFSNGGVAGGPSVPNTQMLIDRAAIGDSFFDVFTSLTIPEPTSMATALAGVAGLALRRRRRAG
jgi:MYXO-CTERM domain-containing protein